MKEDLSNILKDRILLLDGAMGTMIQRYRLEEEDFRGDEFQSFRHPLKGCHDVLTLTQPRIIREIHQQYLEAGADIIKTNTFNASVIPMSDYSLEGEVYRINLQAARLAKEVASRYSTSEKPRFVAGTIGPTNHSASLSPLIRGSSFRPVTFDDLYDSYRQQISGLLKGGVDLFVVETIFDTLNAKAALVALFDLLEKNRPEIPVIVSLTLTDQSGRTLSGQTPEAFLHSVSHFPILAAGLNCSPAPKELRPYLEILSAKAPFPVAVYPNAGMPDESGEYDETPASMATVISGFIRDGLINLTGGCCGTTPEHIRCLAEVIRDAKPRVVPEPSHNLLLSGLDPLTISPGSPFINIGEKTSVSGSKKFARLIREDRFEEALAVARRQVENGARIIDISMDDAFIDAGKAMVRFLRMAASDPDIARVPVMIDSSRWEVIIAGLKCVQGKPIVNSISLKDGEETFLAHARQLKRFGAAVVVMSFDEEGQATTFERKTMIAQRSWRLLTQQAGFPPEDIIFDPNILTIATGLEGENHYAVDFLEAVKWIKAHLPYARITGGISNLSFSFRGNEPMREAMHSVFLFHAIRAGLDMGIVDTANLPPYEEIPSPLRSLIEDVIFDKREDATERLLAWDPTRIAIPARKRKDEKWNSLPVEMRLEHDLMSGITGNIDADIDEALEKYGRGQAVIEGPLMKAMNKVSELFSQGKMFLPQVVKSARVMKKAVARLAPSLEGGNIPGGRYGAIVLATVKGDVHDIGKNIAGVVLACNGFEVVDLGIMAPVEKIMQAAIESKADFIGLSGLIAPSLDEMANVAREMQRRGFTIPLLIGGAATSEAHTAIMIDPLYNHAVIHIKDASCAAGIMKQLVLPESGPVFVKTIKKKYEEIRIQHEQVSRPVWIPLADARKNRFRIPWNRYIPPKPHEPGKFFIFDYPLEELIPYIGWTSFFHAWRLEGRYPGILKDPVKGQEARRLTNDAKRLLHEIVNKRMLLAKGAAGIFPCNASGDDVIVFADDTRTKVLTTLHFLRNQQKKEKNQPNLCLADFIAPVDSGVPDYIGGFAITTGLGVEEWINFYQQQLDDYRAILVRMLADCLAEAFAERLHALVRTRYWGYEAAGEETLTGSLPEKQAGIRPAPGYPSCPDHSEKETLFNLLEVEKHINITLTENFMMYPAASISGYYFSHPDSKNFDVGKIGRDQLSDYAKRKNISFERAEKLLMHNLNYK